MTEFLRELRTREPLALGAVAYGFTIVMALLSAGLWIAVLADSGL